MTLTKNKPPIYYDGNRDAKIIFNNINDTFSELDSIFKSFRDFETIFSHYKNNDLFGWPKSSLKNFQVISVSKKSPLEIIIGSIDNEWLEILWFLINLDYENLERNIQRIYKTATEIIRTFNEEIERVKKRLPESQADYIVNFLRWLCELGEVQLKKVLQFVHNHQLALMKISQIILL